MAKLLKRYWRNFVIFIIFLLAASNSGIPSLKFTEQVRVQTRWIEFDYVEWTIDALFTKSAQAALGTHRYLDEKQQAKIMQDYLAYVQEHSQLKSTITQIYADPNISNPEQMAQEYLVRQRQVQEEMAHVGLLAEAVLQQQITSVLKNNQLTFWGQPIPPVQYHVTALPYALIVSPRDVIRQDADISLLPDLTLDEIVKLEKQVETALNVSALVVPVGGVGVYPTMVMETSNLTWLTEVVSHEWTHNYLTWHPLGMLYMESPELRTINETTANISGKELGGETYQEFYATLFYPPNPGLKTASPVSVDEVIFDFRAEMRETRVTADQLLADGKIEEAEAYMEQRRSIFIKNGYSIRKLNQAYFAFYGAYADTPGGAAGDDPIGAAVRQLRAEHPSLSSFLKEIAWVTSYEGLLARLSEMP